MLSLVARPLLVSTALLVLAGLPAACPGDAAPASSRPAAVVPTSAASAWSAARGVYEVHVAEVRRDALALLRKPIDDARRLGDGETRERLEAEAEALKRDGTWPESQPAAHLRKRLLEGRESIARAGKDSAIARLQPQARKVLETLHDRNALAEWHTAADRVEVGAERRRLDGAETTEYALDLRLERQSDRGGIRLTVPNPDGGRLEFLLGGADPKSGTLASACDVFVLGCQGQVVLLVDGTPRRPGRDVIVSALEGAGHDDDESIELRASDAEVRFAVTRARVKPLAPYPVQFFDDLRAKDKTSTSKATRTVADLGLVAGAVYTGEFVDRDGQTACTITVQEANDSSATLLVVGQQLRMLLRCTRTKGSRLQVDAIDVKEDKTWRRRSLTEIEVRGTATEKSLKLSGTCRCELPNRISDDKISFSGSRQP